MISETKQCIYFWITDYISKKINEAKLHCIKFHWQNIIEQYSTYHLPVTLHLSEDWLLGPHTLIPTFNHLRVVGHSTVLVLGGVVAQMKHFTVLLFVSGSEHKTWSLVETKKSHFLIKITTFKQKMHPFSCTTSLHWGSLGGHRDIVTHSYQRLFCMTVSKPDCTIISECTCVGCTNRLLKDERITEWIQMIINTLKRMFWDDAKEESWQKKKQKSNSAAKEGCLRHSDGKKNLLK